MEIPTHTGRDINKALEIIEAQALEIRELQAVIVRLRTEIVGGDEEIRMLTNELNKMEGA